jgi:hypothetical protein
MGMKMYQSPIINLMNALIPGLLTDDMDVTRSLYPLYCLVGLSASARYRHGGQAFAGLQAREGAPSPVPAG